MNKNMITNLLLHKLLVFVLLFGFSATVMADNHTTPKVDPQATEKKSGRFTIPSDATADTVPPGTIVTVLPEDCSKTMRKSGTYYSCKNGIYLQPSVVDGKRVYVVIGRP